MSESTAGVGIVLAVAMVAAVYWFDPGLALFVWAAEIVLAVIVFVVTRSQGAPAQEPKRAVEGIVLDEDELGSRRIDQRE